MTLSDNPFAVLSAVAAPAILTNACSLLSLNTANRLARAVDRTRVVLNLRGDLPTGHHDLPIFARQLDYLHRRGRMLLTCLQLFHLALAMFAGTALVAIAGSAFVAYDMPLAFHAAAVIGFIVGSSGVLAIAIGCSLMVRETQLAMQGLSEEHALTHHKPGEAV